MKLAIRYMISTGFQRKCVFAELLTSTQIYLVKEILFVFTELLTSTELIRV
jgi:hypothetical protein